MFHSFRFCRIIALLSPLMLALAGTSSAAASASTGEPIVVLVTLDGFPNYVLQDPTAVIPNLRRLRSQGFSPLGGMEVSNPSTTWTNHTTLVTGVPPSGHGVLFNGKLRFDADGLPSRPDPTATRSELVHAPMLFEAAHSAGMSTGAINWPCTRAATGLDDSWPDTPEPIVHMTPRLRDELRSAGILRPEDKSDLRAYFGAGRDALRIEAACHLLKHRPPRLLLIHLTNTDGIQHEYGPDTPAAATAFAWADALIGSLVDTIDTAGLRARTTLIVTADHGFTAPEKTLVPDQVLIEAGFNPGPAREGDSRPRVRVMGGGGYASIYFFTSPTADQIADLNRRFRAMPGVAEVATPEHFAKWGFPDPASNRDMGSLVLFAEDFHAFGAGKTASMWAMPRPPDANRGVHGGLSTQPKLHALFIAVGPQIAAGAPEGAVAILDVAPTIAQLLQIDFPSAHGRPIADIVR
jgi:predicted AlkP superfamily pyrophosphatase or phosphodiesterase